MSLGRYCRSGHEAARDHGKPEIGTGGGRGGRGRLPGSSVWPTTPGLFGTYARFLTWRASVRAEWLAWSSGEKRAEARKSGGVRDVRPGA